MRRIGCRVDNAIHAGYTHIHQQGLHNIAAAVKKQSFNLNNQSAVTNQTFHLRRRRRRLDNQSILSLSSFFSMCYIDIYIFLFSLLFFFFLCSPSSLSHIEQSDWNNVSASAERYSPTTTSPPPLFFMYILKESKSNTRERGSHFESWRWNCLNWLEYQSHSSEVVVYRFLLSSGRIKSHFLLLLLFILCSHDHHLFVFIFRSKLYSRERKESYRRWMDG